MLSKTNTLLSFRIIRATSGHTDNAREPIRAVRACATGSALGYACHDKKYLFSKQRSLTCFVIMSWHIASVSQGSDVLLSTQRNPQEKRCIRRTWQHVVDFMAYRCTSNSSTSFNISAINAACCCCRRRLKSHRAITDVEIRKAPIICTRQQSLPVLWMP